MYTYLFPYSNLKRGRQNSSFLNPEEFTPRYNLDIKTSRRETYLSFGSVVREMSE